MKKIIQIGGLALVAIAPLGVVISCGNNDKNEDDKKEVVASISINDIFKHIKSDTNQLPSKIAKPTDFKLKVPHGDKEHVITATVTTWKANDHEGYIDYVITLTYGDSKKEISGKLTDYITTQNAGDKKAIESITLANVIDKLPKATAVLPSTIDEPSNSMDINGANILILEWDPMDSLGQIHFEVQVSKGGYTKTLNGVVDGYKTEAQHLKEQTQLDSITHNSFKNFPIGKATLLPDDKSIVWPDKDALKLNESFNPNGVISVENVSWDFKNKDNGEVHWSITLKHKNLTTNRKISGTLTGFMTKAQKEAKDFIDGIDKTAFKSTLSGLPAINASKLPSELSTPTNISSTLPGTNVSLKMWDPRNSKGEVEYEVEVEKLGFKKTFIYTLSGFQTQQDRNDWEILDSVHPESLLDFTAPDSSTMPSMIAKPNLTAPVEGMTATVTKWETNDYAGTISWTIKTTYNGKEKETSGKIEGFAYAPWNAWNDTTFPEGVKFFNSMYSNTIDGDLVIPNSVEEIGYYFLNGTTIKGNLVIPNNFETTSWAMFWGSKIKGTLDMSHNTKMKNLSNQSFSRTSINKLILPKSLETIEFIVFWESTLNDFSIANLTNLKSIGSRAFGHVVLPSNFALPPQKVELSGDVFQGSTLPNGFKIPTTWDDTKQLKAAFASIVQKGHWELNGQATNNNEPQPGSTYVY